MPQVDQPETPAAGGGEFPAAPTLGERIDLVVGFLRRRYLIILFGLLVTLPAAAFYDLTARATYTASATMMIETRKSLFPESMGEASPDAAWIESQIGVLKSQNVAAYVVKQLHLAEDRQFIGYGAGLMERVMARLGWKAPEATAETDAERTGQAVGSLMSQLDVRRVGQSYILRIDFRSHNPDQAIKVANAMIDGYIFEQLNAKYQANRRAGDWLQERLQALREQTSAAERAVIEFKAKNNIVTTGGTLMNDKQLSEISGQLGSARAHAADVQARLERIEAVRNAYQQNQAASAADENVSEAMANPIITTLRTRYLDLVNREAEWSTRYGKNHVAVVNLRNQIRDVRKSIRDELGRIEETTRSEYEIAKKRQDEIEKAMATLVSQSTETNQAQIALFSLQAAAQSYRKIYDNFLQRHTEAVQQQTYPISDARQISAASVARTGPPGMRIWMTALFAGGMLGVGLGMLREIMDRGFRTREQVRTVLDTECLALVPRLTAQAVKGVGSGRQSLAASMGTTEFAASIGRRPGPRSINLAAMVLRNVIDAPFSPYAEAIRSIKLTVDLNSVGKYTKVIGLTSCLPHEGKSTVAAAMAALIAQSGASVILVDCDLRNPSVSRALTPDASVGFTDVIAGKVALADAVWTDPATKMAFLPAGANSHSPYVTEILASQAAKSVFSSLQIKFDYVIVDLAPLVAALDVRATMRLIDSYVLVIEWGVTKIDAVQYALRNTPGFQDRIAGAVLNKVDIGSMSRYDSYGARHYYGQSRQAYGQPHQDYGQPRQAVD